MKVYITKSFGMRFIPLFSQDGQGDAGTGLGIGQGMMVVRQVVAAAGSHRLQLVVGQLLPDS